MTPEEEIERLKLGLNMAKLFIFHMCCCVRINHEEICTHDEMINALNTYMVEKE